eukprot:TRINITY_DN5325_c0_g1_i4.p1 TRINITY_DN5325_c0_g1~~TRINITY_DN5325_c0_g1_i4.p1  ORF type:complete len:147 (-),score=39.53 TRINITY_DN5325_c0_g1_i4:128-568(-)
MSTFFEKQIYICPPDYGNRRILWKQTIERLGVHTLTAVDLQSLAHLTQNYTSGMIHHVVSKTLVPLRIKKLDHRPLSIEEIIHHLSRMEAISKDEVEAFKTFMMKLPIFVERYRTNHKDELEEEDEKGKGKGGKKDAKGTGKGKGK